MNEQKAIDFFKNNFPDYIHEEPSEKQIAYNTAIKALEEIQQYREIGTVKEIRIREAQFKRLSEGYLNDLTLLREYQSIGTIEEFKALKEKNEPKSVKRFKKNGEFFGQCKVCKRDVFINEKYCAICGQALDWQ